MACSAPGLIEVLLTADLITDYQLPLSILNGEWVKLTVFEPGDYQAQWTSEGPSEVQTVFNKTYPVAAPQKYSFTVNFKDPRQNVRMAVEEQAERAVSTLINNVLIPLQVRDYMNPEREAVKLGLSTQTRPYTVRQCVAYKTDSSVTGNIYRNGRLLSQGWSMTFHDIALKNP